MDAKQKQEGPSKFPAEWQTRLQEDLGSVEEAEALRGVVAHLARWEAPQPTPAATARLVERLVPLVPPQAAAPLIPSRWSQLTAQLADWWPLLFLRAQVRVVQREMWLASLLVMALGVLVTLALYQPPASGVALPEVLPFVWVAPLVAAVGVALLYGPGVVPALELELALPAGPRLVLLARLVLVFGFNLLLGILASIVLALALPTVSLWPLIVAWLAPMTFLAALAFLLTTVTLDPAVGILVSMALWVLQSLRVHLGAGFLVARWPDLMAPMVQPYLWAGALLLVLVALWLTGREEQVFREVR